MDRRAEDDVCCELTDRKEKERKRKVVLNFFLDREKAYDTANRTTGDDWFER